MDGRSLLPLLIGDTSDHNLGSGLKSRLAALGGNAVAYAATWRHAVLVEHLFHTANIKCVQSCTFEEGLVSQRGNYPQTDVWCADVRALTTCWGTSGADPEWQRPMCEGDCYPTEDEANNCDLCDIAIDAPQDMSPAAPRPAVRADPVLDSMASCANSKSA